MKTFDSNQGCSSNSGFTLVELGVSMALLALIGVILFSITSQTQSLFKSTTGKTEIFEAARSAFDSVNRGVGQATLNTYYDYFNPDGTKWAGSPLAAAGQAPGKYDRFSELHFTSGPAQSLITDSLRWSGDTCSNGDRPGHSIFFQAPFGYSDNQSFRVLDKLLCARGYYLEYNNDDPLTPDFLVTSTRQKRYRYRLMQLIQPAEELSVYTSPSANPTAWFNNAIAARSSQRSLNIRAIAENVVGFYLLPKRSKDEGAPGYTGGYLAPGYQYDSRTTTGVQRSQMPPIVQVTMVAVDESSMTRFLDGQGAGTRPTFEAANSFTDPGNLHADLQRLTDKLQEERLNYRVFTTDVSILGAKWSEN